MGEAKRRALFNQDYVSTAKLYVVENDASCIADFDHRVQEYSNAVTRTFSINCQAMFLTLFVPNQGVVETLTFTHPKEISDYIGSVFNARHARRECAQLIPFVKEENRDAVGRHASHPHPTHLGSVLMPKIVISSSQLTGDMIFVRIPKQSILRMDPAGLLKALDDMVATPASLIQHSQKINFLFEGFESDPREVFQIDSIKEYLSLIAQFAPWWLQLIHPSSYIVWFGALGPYRIIEQNRHGNLKIACDYSLLKPWLDALFETSTSLVNRVLGESDDAILLNENVLMEIQKLTVTEPLKSESSAAGQHA